MSVTEASLVGASANVMAESPLVVLKQDAEAR